MCTNKEELCHFMAHTYLFFLNKDELSALSARIDKALEALARYQLIFSLDDGNLEVSTLGEVAARKGIRAATAVRMVSFLELAKDREAQDLEALHLLSLTEEGKRVNLPLSSVEHRSRIYESMMKETVGVAAETLGEDLARTINPRLMPTTQEAKSLKLALLLTDWIQGEPLSGLEEKYRCYAGTIRGLSEEMSWLADANAAIAEVVGCSPALRQRLTDLSDRLVFGVDTQSLSLARLRLPGIGREEIKTLVRAGFDSKAALEEASPEVLSSLLPGWSGWPTQ
jgi:replicative superfamily II helicase